MPSDLTDLPERQVSLDAYRGFIMLVMASAGLRLSTVAESFPDSDLWRFLSYQFSHVEWVGCAFWDLIQPSFMFMVGVALPYSYASRKARGESSTRTAAHVIYRAVVLVFLGVFLSSNWSSQTSFTFVNVLTQIGLGYAFLFLALRLSWKGQALTAALILVGYWLVFVLYPLPPENFDYARVGLTEGWQHMRGFFAHWEKNVNMAADLDVWFLNLFPRPEPFVHNAGGYQTLNFVPSMATMILGVLAGNVLRGPRRPGSKFWLLASAGMTCLVIGQLLGWSICPIVKRIWTPSWAVFSSGWTFLMLAGFYLVIDVWRLRKWAFPFVVVGMNSITMYCMAQLLKPWIRDTLKRHTSQELFGGVYGPMWQSLAVLIVLWLVCWWLYRKRVFLKI